jgi:two-component system NarL family sensor kinase
LKGAANVNVVTCSRLEALVDGTGGLCYHASVPLYAHGRKLGVVNVASADWRELSVEDLRLLYTVGDLISMAIERARLFASSQQYGAIEERNRLAREIHDTLAQGLTGIILQLEAVDALLAARSEDEEIVAGLQRALALSRANLEEARRSMQNLRAAPLESRTLAEALALLVESEQKRTSGMQVKLAVKGKVRTLPDRIEAGLYRIAQEALANSVRHARARNVTVELVILRDQVKLAISDDGQGFDATKMRAGGRSGYGLVGMNERAKLLGGSLQVQSSPGEGTRIEVAVPLPAEAIQ